MPTTETRTFAADIAQAMRDWDNATPAQRIDALAKANDLAAAAQRRLTDPKFAVEANRSGSSIFGAANGWVKDNAGEPETYDTLEEAEAVAERLNRAIVSPNVWYVAKPFGR